MEDWFRFDLFSDGCSRKKEADDVISLLNLKAKKALSIILLFLNLAAKSSFILSYCLSFIYIIKEL